MYIELISIIFEENEILYSERISTKIKIASILLGILIPQNGGHWLSTDVSFLAMSAHPPGGRFLLVSMGFLLVHMKCYSGFTNAINASRLLKNI